MTSAKLAVRLLVAAACALPLAGSVQAQPSLTPQQFQAGALQPQVFDLPWYQRTHREVAGMHYVVVMNHWLTIGVREGRQSSPQFSIRDYVNRYPDLIRKYGPTNNFVGAMEHWIQYGQREGRDPRPQALVTGVPARPIVTPQPTAPAPVPSQPAPVPSQTTLGMPSGGAPMNQTAQAPEAPQPAQTTTQTTSSLPKVAPEPAPTSPTTQTTQTTQTTATPKQAPTPSPAPTQTTSQPTLSGGPTQSTGQTAQAPEPTQTAAADDDDGPDGPLTLLFCNAGARAGYIDPVNRNCAPVLVACAGGAVVGGVCHEITRTPRDGRLCAPTPAGGAWTKARWRTTSGALTCVPAKPKREGARCTVPAKSPGMPGKTLGKADGRGNCRA